jgi:hypothetical protein
VKTDDAFSIVTIEIATIEAFNPVACFVIVVYEGVYLLVAVVT